MDRVRVAYRDDDRTPVLYCVKEMAARHYDLNVEILCIRDQHPYEAAIFDGSADIIMEHVEYLFAEVSRGKKVTMFAAPVTSTEASLVVASGITDHSQLKGKRIAIRPLGRPHNIIMRLRHMGLEGQVETQLVTDQEVGRWGQWKKIVSGECSAAFVSCLYLPPALEAGLRVLDAPDLPIVGVFAHATSTEWARAHDSVMDRYVRALVHGICLMRLRREEALDIVKGEPARLIGAARGITDPGELERWFDCIAAMLQPKPWPTAEGIRNSYEIATQEWPVERAVNPLTLWDLHWLKRIDDEGFIDNLIARMR